MQIVMQTPRERALEARKQFKRAAEALLADDRIPCDTLVNVLVRCGRIRTKEQAIKYIHAGHVRLNGELAVDPDQLLRPGSHILRVNRNKPIVVVLKALGVELEADVERCPNCDTQLTAKECKARCLNCGYFDDCGRGPT